MTSERGRLALLLVVDDEPGMRDTLADILCEFDFQVDEAANGLEAVNRIQRARYDLVLMDIRMPVMDGVEALGRIRETCPLLPVIMMTACADTTAIQRACAHGARAILYKPFDVSELVTLVQGIATC